MDRQIQNEPYYHGLLPREELKQMLKNNGDFLIRMSEPHAGERAYILSMQAHEDRGEHGILHFIIGQNEEGQYGIEKHSFPTIQDLVNHYHVKKVPVYSKDSETIIRSPIKRQPWELLHEDIEATKKLGEGAYGEVHAGKLRLKSGAKVPIAVKMAKMEALTKEQSKDFMREARLMRSFDHPHIVKFYGVAAGTEPLMMVMELADCGSLDSYLTKNPQFPVEKRMEMCAQASYGIEYLHFKNCIHCDIAARNCLYGDGKVKISDFGLAREGTTFKRDPSCHVPLRWLAPEVFTSSTYTQKTDVWAYGIMCWEVFSKSEPYVGMTVAEVTTQVTNGYRLQFPEPTPQEFGSLITRLCWTQEPNDRSNMSDIAYQLERLTNVPRPPLSKNKINSERNSVKQTKAPPSSESFPSVPVAKKKGGKKLLHPTSESFPSSNKEKKKPQKVPTAESYPTSKKEKGKTNSQRTKEPYCPATARSPKKPPAKAKTPSKRTPSTYNIPATSRGSKRAHQNNSGKGGSSGNNHNNSVKASGLSRKEH